MRSACSRRARVDSSPYTTTEITSRRLRSLLITGSSASSGKVVMRSTAFLMSWSTRSGSSPSRTVAVTVAMPSDASAWISLMPSTSVRLSSTFRTMPSSTSSGAAPG